MNRTRSKRQITVAVIAVLTLLFSSLITLSPAEALSTNSATGKIKVSSATMRKSASSKGKKVIKLKKNTTVTIGKEVFTKKKSTGSKTRWYYVSANGKSGYIRSDMIKNISYNAVQGQAEAKVTYRKGAGSSMSKKGTISKGSMMQIVLAAKAKGSGTTWYKIRSGSKYYYVSSSSVNIVPASVDFSVSGLRYPETLTEGKAFTIKGKITSSYIISSGSVRVLNSAGQQVLRTDVAVNSNTFDILKADKNTKFGSLSPGTYSYYVDAVVNGRTYTQVSKTFTVQEKPKPAETQTTTVAAAADQGSTQTEVSLPSEAAEAPPAVTTYDGVATFTVSELRYPEALYEGGAFTIKGKISCNATISKGVVHVTDASGNDVLSTEVEVNGPEFNILDADKNVRFGTLAAGNYTYLVDVYVNGQAYNQVRKAFVVKYAAKAERIVNKAFELAWPAGTSSSKYSYGEGSPTAAYRLALDTAYPNRSSWGAIAQTGASCDVFVGTVIRSSGVDKSVPRGLKDQFPYYAGSAKYTRVNYTGDRSQLRSGDIIMFTRNAGNTHTCIYIKKDGKEYIAEANYGHTYGTIVTSASSITSKLKLSDKKRMEIYRIVE